MKNLALNKKLCVVLVLLAGCFWGMTGFYVRLLSSYGISSVQIACIRNITAPVILLLIALVKYKGFPKLKKKSDIVLFAASGLFSVFLTSIFYFATISKASVSVACILMYTAPVFVIVFSFFIFKEKIGMKKLAAMIIAFIGCFFVSGVLGSGQKISLSAFMFGIGSGIAYALYSIFSKLAINRGYSPFDATLYSFIAAGICSLFFADYPRLLSFAAEHKELIAFYPLTGLMASVVPFLLYTSGLSGLESGVASVISCSEPMVASLVSVFLLSEPMSGSGVFGIVLIIISIIILR